jgi:hypothetical protein
MEKEYKEDYQKDLKASSLKTNNGISDREMLRIMKEEKTFPQPFSKRIKLSYLVSFYVKYWNGDFTDDSDSTS